ncbi:MAG: glycosyltransferase family 10, partial [Alphaproteobacteria bacterium]
MGSHNRDDTNQLYRWLKTYLAEAGCDLITQRDCPVATADAAIFIDCPGGQMPQNAEETGKSVLVVWEPPLHSPYAYKPEVRAKFKQIFTWDDSVVSPPTTMLLKYGQPWPEKPFDVAEALRRKMKLACTISSFKRVRMKGELYGKREELIRWYEANAPKDFDLYGMGWDKVTFNGLLRPLNRVPALRKALAPKWPSWRGPVANKGQVIGQYKFSYAYENFNDKPGYISEKIFDVAFAGTVPVYLGARNIADYVPKECFINADDFASVADIHQFISTMSDKDYRKRLQAIHDWLEGYKGP